jgi:hypothetical protein
MSPSSKYIRKGDLAAEGKSTQKVFQKGVSEIQVVVILLFCDIPFTFPPQKVTGLCMFMYVYVCLCTFMYVYVCLCMFMYVCVCLRRNI